VDRSRADLSSPQIARQPSRMTGEENKGAPRRKPSDANLLLTNSRISEAVSAFVQHEGDEIEKDLAKFNEQINQIENAKIQRSNYSRSKRSFSRVT
jgi:hypothetical protein